MSPKPSVFTLLNILYQISKSLFIAFFTIDIIIVQLINYKTLFKVAIRISCYFMSIFQKSLSLFSSYSESPIIIHMEGSKNSMVLSAYL
ncbi:hypothetical protein HK17_01585 [Acetobacter indonesiensis]|uniref:Uncharacterized protein n=1 Tax=Acetobacter indonesiensis TaxID=104101 RepID=A0A252AFW9_9PROT|nr:hypothetical protein HK17_01585 [Acetobacter indonesiensis]